MHSLLNLLRIKGLYMFQADQPSGLVVRVSDYWSWGPGFDSPAEAAKLVGTWMCCDTPCAAADRKYLPLGGRAIGVGYQFGFVHEPCFPFCFPSF
jgi:hypothetical protein